MAMKCAQCGTRLVPGTRSCPGCGQQFATEVPPDPAAPQAAPPPQAGQPQAPGGQAPPAYGQPPQGQYSAPPQAPPQYGQPPQSPPVYGQPPQGGQAPYGQTPPQGQFGAPPQTPPPQYGQPPQGAQTPYGQPPPYGQAPPTPAGGPSKKAYPWIGAAVVIGLGIVRVLSHLGAEHPPTPTPGASRPATPAAGGTPAQPASTGGNTPTTDGDGGGSPLLAVSANYKAVGGLITTMGQIADADHSAPDWKANVEQNAQALKAATQQGMQLPWPDDLQDAKTEYQAGLTDIATVADRWPAIIENDDKAGAQEVVPLLTKGAGEMTQAADMVKAKRGGGSGDTQQMFKSGSQAPANPVRR